MGAPKQARSPEDWIGYWEQDTFWSGSRLWKIHADLFLRKAAPILNLQSTDAVLDIGCGPGYLARRIAPRVASVCAVDTSERFVQMCRENCWEIPHVEAMLLGRNYTDLSIFGRRFSLFLCASVVQYYRDVAEVEALIRSAAAGALPGARMLIADLPLRRGSLLGRVWDGCGSLLIGIQEGYAPELFRSLWIPAEGRAFYGSFRKKVRELTFSIPELKELIQRMKLDAVIIRRGLSLCANRPSLLIRF